MSETPVNDPVIIPNLSEKIAWYKKYRQYVIYVVMVIVGAAGGNVDEIAKYRPASAESVESLRLEVEQLKAVVDTITQSNLSALQEECERLQLSEQRANEQIESLKQEHQATIWRHQQEEQQKAQQMLETLRKPEEATKQEEYPATLENRGY